MKRLIFLLLILTACSSAVDTTVKPGNEGFVIGNGSTAVVLTHGLGASPYEIRGLAEYLAERNMTVYGVRLAGHGTSVADLDTKKWQDWYSDYRIAYDNARLNHSKVFVGGMSLGGVLALKLEEDDGADGVIALAPALMLNDPRTNYLWFYGLFTRYSSRVIPEERQPYYYGMFSLKSVAESLKLADVVVKNLSRITKPLLIMQYTNDTRVTHESPELVYNSVSSKAKTLTWINGTGHVFLLDKNMDTYFEEIYKFIKENS